MSDTDGPRHELNTTRYEPEQDMLDARQDERDAVEQAAMVADQVLPRRVERIAHATAQRTSRRYGLAAALFAALIALGVAALSLSVAQAAASTASSAQQTVSDALAKLQTANEQLTSRGQEPVKVEPDPDPSEAIRAAVLAQVLAQLPAVPTAEQVAAQLQPAAVSAVAGTDRAVLAQMVADYFAANQPPGPTQVQIQDAVDRAYAANPPRDGRDGQSPPCLSEPAQCRGTDGVNGQDGQDGQDGKDGKDSVVPGPEGPACPPGSSLQTVQYGLDVTKTGPACVFD